MVLSALDFTEQYINSYKLLITNVQLINMFRSYSAIIRLTKQWS